MPDLITFSLHPIGFIRSSLKLRAEAPKFGNEGAPDAWLEVSPTVTEGLQGIAVGDEIILLTWFHESRRDILKLRPVGTRACRLRVFSLPDLQTARIQSVCIE